MGSVAAHVFVLVSIDEYMLVVSAGGKVVVWTAHRRARERGAGTKCRGGVYIAERMRLVTVVDEVMLTIEAGIGAVAVVLVEASGSSGCGRWHGSADGDSSWTAVETFVEVGLGLIVREAGSLRAGVLTTASFAHLPGGIEVLLELMVARSVGVVVVMRRPRTRRWRYRATARERAVVLLRRRHGAVKEVEAAR